ncbi:MAG: HRDC domain-containing protein [Candidatus Dormibacteria bacterium]
MSDSPELVTLRELCASQREQLAMYKAQESRTKERQWSQKTPCPHTDPGTGTGVLRDRLRWWRLEHANSTEVKAHHVFTDAQLDTLMDSIPKTRSDLVGLPGWHSKGIVVLSSVMAMVWDAYGWPESSDEDDE